MVLKKRTDMVSAIEEHDVGCPEPAAWVDSMEWILSLVAMSLSWTVSSAVTGILAEFCWDKGRLKKWQRHVSQFRKRILEGVLCVLYFSFNSFFVCLNSSKSRSRVAKVRPFYRELIPRPYRGLGIHICFNPIY